MLHWSELETTEPCDLHFSLGGTPGDENDLDLRHCVVTTYAKPPVHPRVEICGTWGWT